jgi:hypothetical protein
MKDIVITKKQIQKELKVVLVCFSISFLSSIWAVFYYKAPAIEILTSLHYVLAAALVLYFLFGLLRIAGFLLLKLFRKK